MKIIIEAGDHKLPNIGTESRMNIDAAIRSVEGKRPKDLPKGGNYTVVVEIDGSEEGSVITLRDTISGYDYAFWSEIQQAWFGVTDRYLLEFETVTP